MVKTELLGKIGEVAIVGFVRLDDLIELPPHKNGRAITGFDTVTALDT